MEKKAKSIKSATPLIPWLESAGIKRGGEDEKK